jgi:hypothetical protein
VPQNGRLREIPQKVQKLAAHRSLASGDVSRIGPALTLNCGQGLPVGAWKQGTVYATMSSLARSAKLFDHLIRPQQERFGDHKPERFCRLEIDHQLEAYGLLDRKFGRIRALENLVDINR